MQPARINLFSNLLPATPHHQRNRSAGGERGTHQQQASLELSSRGAHQSDHIRTNKSTEISDRINECDPGRRRRARQQTRRHRPERPHHGEHAQHRYTDGENGRPY